MHEMKVVAQSEGKLFIEVVKDVGVIIDLRMQSMSPMMSRERAAMVGGWVEPKEDAGFAVEIVKQAIIDSLELGEGIAFEIPVELADQHSEELIELFTALTSDTQDPDDGADVVPIIEISEVDVAKFNGAHDASTGHFAAKPVGSAAGADVDLDGKSIEEWKAQPFADRRAAFEAGKMPVGFESTSKPRPLTLAEQGAFPGEMVHAYYFTEGPHALSYVAGFGKFETNYKDAGLTHNQVAKTFGFKNDEAIMQATGCVKVAIYPLPGGAKILSLWSDKAVPPKLVDKIAGHVYDKGGFGIEIHSKVDINVLSGSGSFTGKMADVLKSETPVEDTSHYEGCLTFIDVDPIIGHNRSLSFADVMIAKYNRAHDSLGRFTSAAGAGGMAPSTEAKGKWRGSKEIQEEIDRADGMMYKYASKTLDLSQKGDMEGAKKSNDMFLKWKAHKDKQIELREKAVKREDLDKLKNGVKPDGGEIPDSEFALKKASISGMNYVASGPYKESLIEMKLSQATGLKVRIAPGTDMQLVKDAVDQIVSLKATYPKVEFHSLTFKKLSHQSYYAQAGPGRLEINTNRTAAQVHKSYAHDVASGFHPPLGKMNGMQAIVTHEFGHLIDFHLQKKAVQKPIGKITKKESGKVSKYAQKNGMESFAESFSAITAGTSSGLGLAPHITKAMLKKGRDFGIL